MQDVALGGDVGVGMQGVEHRQQDQRTADDHRRAADLDGRVGGTALLGGQRRELGDPGGNGVAADALAVDLRRVVAGQPELDRGERGGFRGDRPERSERPAADTPAA